MIVSKQANGAGGPGKNIREVASDAGVTAWLVEEHAVPLLAMEIAFRGGTAQDPPGKEGLVTMLASLLDEGAGDLDAQGFQEEVEANAVELSFSAGKDTLTASLRTLVRRQDAAFRLLGLALAAPRFDQDAIDRVRAQLLAGLRRERNEPNAVAGKAWFATAFAGHPYGRPDRGTPESLAAITRDDLMAMHRALVARGSVCVTVVGAIGEEALSAHLSRLFGPLPGTATLSAVPDVSVAGLGERLVSDLDIPQSTIRFGAPGLLRSDADFIPATVMNHILGGGSFTSRLWQEVREKRGLAYSVSSSVMAYDRAGLFFGGTATKNERACEALEVIRAEIRRMADKGPEEDELAKAKLYLVGSYALRFDTSAKIAGQLSQVQLDGLGLDYPDRRNALFEAVGMADVRRAADRLLARDALLVTVAGRPEGM
jgi:zinc protease